MDVRDDHAEYVRGWRERWQEEADRDVRVVNNMARRYGVKPYIGTWYRAGLLLLRQGWRNEKLERELDIIEEYYVRHGRYEDYHYFDPDDPNY